MKIQEILDSPDIRAVEIAILDVVETEQHSGSNPLGEEAIRRLLSLRKQMLDQRFVLTDEYKRLLEEFNDRLIGALLEMRVQTINMHSGALNAGMCGVDTVGKVFMSYGYPENHPVQTIRAKKIWGVLNNSLDNYLPMYEDGVESFRISSSDGHILSENQFLYLTDEVDNWNEHLDREKTADMHLCHGFHNLVDHNDFSIFDLLWVRDFSIEISCESTHCTGSVKQDDIDWSKCDYYD